MPSSAARKLSTSTSSSAAALPKKFAVVVSFSGFSIVNKESKENSKEQPMQVTPYLFFSGNCEAAFKFYERALRGKIEMMLPHEGTPAEQHVPADWRKKIMHAKLVVGNVALMGSDAPPDQYKPMQGFSVALGIDTPAEAERVFNALSDNGTITMPLEKTFWAERFGMLVDQFGTAWMINCETKA
ncbi:VOC family protein [Bradyrhizobium prioriisuperbiae]|uniref:VOC family protein n=1 Tax=Bradyrhizobium prioriisuperbiae TaxID=2854389 RepID=UPI0028EB15CC|nr:VOC family protein [Bradyrhizobium prioritasuperba]